MSTTHLTRHAEIDARFAAEQAATLAEMSDIDLYRKAVELDELSTPSGYAVNHRGQGGANRYWVELERRMRVMLDELTEAEIAASMTERELVAAIVANPDAAVERAELARRRHAVGAHTRDLIAA